MDIGQAVRIIQASSEFYSSVSMRCDPLMLGRQGRVVSYAMSDNYEPGWKVNLTNGGEQFFYEEELEVIDSIDGPPVEKTRARKVPNPWWYDDLAELKSRLFNVQVLGHEFSEEFTDEDGHGPWYDSEDHVENKIERLERGEQ